MAPGKEHDKMEQRQSQKTDTRQGRGRLFVYENGRLYFSSRLERRVLFVVTMLLLAGGALSKMGIL